jgi:hypothetical protein
MKLVTFLALAGCGDILPQCDAKDHATPWAHPEHRPGATVREPAPVAVAQEAVVLSFDGYDGPEILPRSTRLFCS